MDDNLRVSKTVTHVRCRRADGFFIGHVDSQRRHLQTGLGHSRSRFYRAWAVNIQDDHFATFASQPLSNPLSKARSPTSDHGKLPRKSV
jgi:hypothetical protein